MNMDNLDKSLQIAVVCSLITVVVVALPKEFIPVKFVLVLIQIALVSYSVHITIRKP